MKIDYVICLHPLKPIFEGQAIRASYEYPLHKANKRQNGRYLFMLRT